MEIQVTPPVASPPPKQTVPVSSSELIRRHKLERATKLRLRR
jgi:hypothetical protein